jgi:hypothetical protein
MAETINRAVLASLISDEIFSFFGWSKRPLKDHNWDCVTKKHAKKTHPADVVFSYDDPFQRVHPYILTDLKSYGKETINFTNVKEALESLAMSVDCALRSASFREFYITENDTFTVVGMLFIYNHDQQYPKGVEEMLKNISPKMVGLRSGLKIAVIDPARITYLRSVANDILVLRGKKQIPDTENCAWFYPDLKLTHPKCEAGPCLTLEMLIGPWQILKYQKGGQDGQSDGFLFYYDGPGKEVEEFTYLLDCLFQFQLVKRNVTISVRMPNSDGAARNTFEKAKEAYSLQFFPVHDLISERLGQISFDRVDKVIPTYGEIDGGMRVNHE